MLLRHTQPGAVDRQALTVNPAKTCQPIGAMYAALGVKGCLPHSHGSQGCCAYHRSALTRHYKEPVMAGTSSFTEGTSVFGGQSNLLQAINNMFSIYDPKIIAVHTTCLSETIGDDIPQIVEKAREDGLIPEGKYVFHANTPSYAGSHVTGYANMVKAMATYFSEPIQQEGKTTYPLNVIPGWVEPADMREIRGLCNRMGVETIMFPDTSGVLDAPMTGKHEMYPDAGATIEELRLAGSAKGTIALGPHATEDAAAALKSKCEVPYEMLELPIGLRATDRFIEALSRMGLTDVPLDIEVERGRLVDLIVDMQQYFAGRRVVLWGDPDQLVSLTEFLVDLGMIPVIVVTGTPGKSFQRRIADALQDMKGECEVLQGAQKDMLLMHQMIKDRSVDLLIGNTYGKYIARDEDIPFVRHGFPILDRIGHQYFPTVGYSGGIRFCEQILNALMDRQDRDAPEESFELTM